MAKRGGVFQRFLELVLDKQSAAKTEKETQAALKRATDPKVIARNISDGVKNVTRGVAAVAAAAAAATVGLLKLAQRGQEVAGVQAAFARVTGDAEGAINLLRGATRGLISDYDLMVGLNKSVSLGASRNAGDFAALAITAQKLGRALGIDAGFALESLNIGIARQSRLYLDNIGIIINVEDANKKYAETLGKQVSNLTAAEQKEGFRIAALEQAKKLTDQLGVSQDKAAESAQRFATSIANIKDNFSLLVVQSPAVQRYFEGMALTLQDMAEGGVEFAIIAAGLPSDLEALQARFRGVAREIEIMQDKIDQSIRDEPATRGGRVGESLRAELDLLEREAALIGRRVTIVAGLANAASALPPPKTPEELAAEVEAAEKLRDAEDKRLGLLGKAVDLGVLQRKEWDELVRIYAASTKALQAGNLTLEERLRLTGRLREAEGALSQEIGGIGAPSARLLDPGSRMARIPLTMSPLTRDTSLTELPFANTFFDNFGAIESAAQMAALGMQQAFQDAFLALGEEGNAFANLFGSLFKGMASAVLSSIAQVASVKVGENVAKALGAAGEGFLGHAGGFPAAAKFMASAAAWAALGGAAGAAAASVGGGGSFRGSDVVGRQIDKLDRAGDIIIYVDGVDPKNPRHQALIGKTAAEYRQRSGAK